MTDDLRDRIAAAFREAGKLCEEDCADEVACDAAHPFQATLLTFDQVTHIEGPVDAIAQVAADVVEALEPTASGRCPRCLCGDCGGRLDEHTEDGCACEACEPSPFLGPMACSLAEFAPDQRIGFIAEQLGPLLSSHLNERAWRRCLTVAHAAYHALYDYDTRENSS